MPIFSTITLKVGGNPNTVAANFVPHNDYNCTICSVVNFKSKSLNFSNLDKEFLQCGLHRFRSNKQVVYSKQVVESWELKLCILCTLMMI